MELRLGDERYVSPSSPPHVATDDVPADAPMPPLPANSPTPPLPSEASAPAEPVVACMPPEPPHASDAPSTPPDATSSRNEHADAAIVEWQRMHAEVAHNVGSYREAMRRR
mmetsp:Transcript_18571/g.32034  ORF Transcript_18571/g.32034 Transcript_18571/m.32034 type:complete len:111 (-) Transcript_18571:67-399(-)